MEWLLDQLKSQWLGVVLGVAGSAVVGLVFYLKSLRAKEPCWAIRSNNLVRDYMKELPDLAVRYGDRQVDSLTISRVLFWNRGRETIRSEDIAKADPLRVEPVGNARVLHAQLLVANSPASQFGSTVVNDPNCAHFWFDFVDHRQGAVFQVIHTGTSSENLAVKGTIVTVGGAEHYSIDLRISRHDWRDFGMTILTAAVLVITASAQGDPFTWMLLPVIVLIGFVEFNRFVLPRLEQKMTGGGKLIDPLEVPMPLLEVFWSDT